MRARRFIFGVLFLAFAAIIQASAAYAQIAPIVVREAKGHRGCLIYLKADGSRLRFKGSPIAAAGSCPDDFIPGRVTRYGPQTYKLEIPGQTCVMYPNGHGRCED
jgi:hypothetical protein